MKLIEDSLAAVTAQHGLAVSSLPALLCAVTGLAILRSTGQLDIQAMWPARDLDPAQYVR